MWGRGAPASWANRPGVPSFTERKVTEAEQRETQREQSVRPPPILGGALSSPTPGSHPVWGAPQALSPTPGLPMEASCAPGGAGGRGVG